MADNKNRKMKAVRWEGKPFSVSVEEVDIPKIKDPLDAIIRVTSSTICGTDLHTYRGHVPETTPLTLGHEVMGIVEEIGPKITTLKKGDRVLVAPIIEQATYNGELSIVGSIGNGGPGFEAFDGGQAEFIRVPFANSNLLILPPGDSHELDYLLLTDILPTADWALDCAGQLFGDTVVVFGAGPVGMLCAKLALLRGAVRVYSVDHVPARLAKAESLGAIPINFAEVDPVAEILKREPNGVDRSCDIVGFEAVNGKGEKAPNTVISWAIQVTRAYGGIGLIGVYYPIDLEPTSPEEAKGILDVPIGDFWLKSLSIKGGICPIKNYQETLKTRIEEGAWKPSDIIDKEFKIEDATKAYRDFADHKLIKPVFRFDHHHGN